MLNDVRHDSPHDSLTATQLDTDCGCWSYGPVHVAPRLTIGTVQLLTVGVGPTLSFSGATIGCYGFPVVSLLTWRLRPTVCVIYDKF